MSRTQVAAEQRLNTPFIRAIGLLSLSAYELRALSAAGPSEESHRAWFEFAEHLLESAQAVMAGASGGSFAGNTISVVRDSVHVAVDVDYVDRLAERMGRHARIGRALGVGETAQDRQELTLTA